MEAREERELRPKTIFALSASIFEFCFLGLYQHPLEGNLREASFAFRITASHVGVKARKPNLANVLIGERGTPEVRLKATAVFVN